MVHAGKHIIDPATGLCEICDDEAIRDLRRGKQPVRQVSNLQVDEYCFRVCSMDCSSLTLGVSSVDGPKWPHVSHRSWNFRFRARTTFSSISQRTGPCRQRNDSTRTLATSGIRPTPSCLTPSNLPSDRSRASPNSSIQRSTARHLATYHG